MGCLLLLLFRAYFACVCLVACVGVFPDIRWAVSLGQYEIADAYKIEHPPLDSEAGDGTPMRFVDPKVLTLIVIVSAACASIAFADVPNELARWMLSKGTVF